MKQNELSLCYQIDVLKRRAKKKKSNGKKWWEKAKSVRVSRYGFTKFVFALSTQPAIEFSFPTVG